jgi:hypothetical protein
MRMIKEKETIRLILIKNKEINRVGKVLKERMKMTLILTKLAIQSWRLKYEKWRRNWERHKILRMILRVIRMMSKKRKIMMRNRMKKSKKLLIKGKNKISYMSIMMIMMTTNYFIQKGTWTQVINHRKEHYINLFDIGTHITTEVKKDELKSKINNLKYAIA